MGQKINPISLRLQKTNRGYDSCWYSDYHYSELFAFDLKVRDYLERVLKQVKYPQGRALITHFSKTSKINLFAFNPSSSRQQRLETFGLKGVALPKVAKKGKLWINTTAKGSFSGEKTFKTKGGVENLGFLQSLGNPLPSKRILVDQETDSWQQLLSKPFVPYLPFLCNPWKPRPLQPLGGQGGNQRVAKGRKYKERGDGNLLHPEANTTLGTGTLQPLACATVIPKKSPGTSGYLCLAAHAQQAKVLPLFSLRNTFIPFYNLKVKRLETACFAKSQKLCKTQDKASYTLERQVESVPRKTLSSQRRFLAPWPSLKGNQGATQSVLHTLGFPRHSKKARTALTHLGGHTVFLAKKPKDTGFPKTPGFKDLLYRPHVERVLKLQEGVSAKLVGFVVSTERQSALFLAHEVVYLLEKRIPFRKIKDQISKELRSSKIVKGIRITCSGRVGGKSKKAQKAKMETFKQGQTSLHVFSSKIDFAQKSALTNFGLVGVKVWICFY